MHSLPHANPQDVLILIAETCEYVTLHGKGDFADTIKGTALEMGKLS